MRNLFLPRHGRTRFVACCEFLHDFVTVVSGILICAAGGWYQDHGSLLLAFAHYVLGIVLVIYIGWRRGE